MMTTLIYLIAFLEENIPTKYKISMQENEYCDGEGHSRERGKGFCFLGGHVKHKILVL
jgi:hypothetical protein